MNSAKPVRIGIIGAGRNTRSRHIPGFRAIPGVEIVVVCNRSEESSRKVADEFRIPRIAGKWHSVVSDVWTSWQEDGRRVSL